MTKACSFTENEPHEETHLLQNSFKRKVSVKESQSEPSIFDEKKDEENPDTLEGFRKFEERDALQASFILKDELSQIIKLAIPVTGTYLLELLPGIFSIMLVGHIDSEFTKEYLDATSLATMFFNITALSIGLGLATAMDTLCSQAHGANETFRIGIYFQTGIIVLSITTFFVSWANFFAKDILIFLGQPENIAELAGKYCRIQVFGIPFLYLYELLRKVLQAQNIATPMLTVAIIANIVNISLGYYLVFKTSLGWLGAAFARTISCIIFPTLLVTYVYLSDHYKIFWSSWDPKKAWEGVRQWVLLGIPGMLQMCFEWWAFEILALICGLLPNAVIAIGTNSILLNISTLSYLCFYGTAVSGNVRVGNALGSGDSKRAKLASHLVLGLALCISLFCASGLVIYRDSLPKLFTHDAELDEYTSKLLVLVGAFQIADSVGACVHGIFRGSGRQSIGAYMNFVAYFIIGIPLGTFLAFHYDLSVFGLWSGMTVGIFLFSIFGCYFILTTDWVRAVEDTKDRVGNDCDNNK